MNKASEDRNETNGSKNGNEICMLCGRTKDKGKEKKNLVCYGCFREYKKMWVKSMAEDLKDISIVEWTLKKAENLTPILKKELLQAEADLDNFKKEVKDQAYQGVTEALRGRTVSKEDFSDILERRRLKLWQDGKGNQLFGKYKYLELRMDNLPLLIEKLQEKIAAHDEQSSMPEDQNPEETE